MSTWFQLKCKRKQHNAIGHTIETHIVRKESVVLRFRCSSQKGIKQQKETKTKKIQKGGDA